MDGTRRGSSLVIDTDTASDDAVALLMAVKLSEVHLVTTVAGNVDVGQATRNALATLELAEADVPVHVGCDRPLLQPRVSAQHVHGHDGMSGVHLARPARDAEPEHAVDALLRAAQEDDGPKRTLVTLGPLTNIAAAVIRDRKFLSRFAGVYCMAGAPDAVGNVSATAEYNVWADPEAAAVVLAASTPETVTLVGWDVSRVDAVMGPDERRRLREMGTRFAAFVDDINQAVLAWATDVTGLAGYDLPDPIALAVAIRPELATTVEDVHARVSMVGETRGQLIVDRRRCAAEPNVRLVRRADSQAFKELLFGVCSIA